MSRSDAQLIGGMIIPVVTPLGTDFEVDVAATHLVCSKLIDSGLGGLFMLGTTGEFYGLTPAQRRTAVDAAVECAAGRVPVLAGISGDSTAASLQTLGALVHSQVSGFVAAAPYFMEYRQCELLDHYRTLSDRAGGPLVLYNYPRRYRHTIEPETIERLLEEGRVFAIKDTGGNRDYMLRLLDLRRRFPHFLVFEGCLPTFTWSARAGVDGAVQAIGNLLPGECAAMWDLARKEEWGDLDARVRKAWTFHQEIEEVAPFAASLKGCISLRGWCSPVPTRPTRSVSADELGRLRQLLDRSYPGWESRAN